MDPNITLTVIIGYFVLLFIISILTGRNANEQTFYTANRNSPWYLVAFGMIGATLSGVTFISIPGAVGNDAWAYMQIVMGYMVGYAAIALILMPLYYRLQLVSIYGYLEKRFGMNAYKTGAVFFLLSRIVGASLRLYLVVLVLQLAIFNYLGISFEYTVLISISLIYIYTFRGGIKTVVWTDTLQTFFMLLGAGLAVYMIGNQLGWSIDDTTQQILQSDYAKIFVWEWAPGNNFFKQFISGAFIALAMTGLDQDMMQKNLTCRTLEDAQKNIFWFSITLVIAKLLFLSLGALIYIYGDRMGIVDPIFAADCALQVKDPDTGEMICRKTDQLFPLISLNYLGPVAGTFFVLGVIAAAYSSADSALTALTTSFCVDILGIQKFSNPKRRIQIRYLVHIGFAAILFLVIVVFNSMNNDAVIWEIFRAAGYTYGPLLGLFAFGMFTDLKALDKWIPWVAIICPLITYLLQQYSLVLLGVEMGFMILPVNGILTFGGLWLVSKGRITEKF